MKAIYQTKGSRQVDIHYVDAGVPAVGVVEESYGGYYLGNSDLYLEDVIQDQEIVYQSLQTNGRSDRAKASTSTDSVINNEQNGGNGRVPKKEGESSQVCNVQSQLAMDEALALALQELENHLGSATLNETTGTQGEMSPTQPSAVNREVNTSGTSVQAVRQDNIDPDTMTYEELQSLGEAIGTESKGLSDELISYLPSSKYKIGFFSKKEKHDECVICYMEYKNRDVLTTLPCQHLYHSKCVTRWLKLNKACPVCNEEVFGS